MSTEMTVLNHMLFSRLKRRFNVVKVNNRGKPMVARTRHDLDGAPRLDISQYGETYAVCCPFCRERGFQLTVNHRFGQLDEHGRQLLFLTKCFHRDCLMLRQNRERLIEMLDARDGDLEEARIFVPQFDDTKRAFEWPGPSTRVDRLPKGHPARRWLRTRGLDPDVIGKRYGLLFGDEDAESLTRGRLIIPIHQRGENAGWQTVEMTCDEDEVDRQPLRYFTSAGTTTSRLLYNLDRARRYGSAILVEEPAHVWACGQMAISSFARPLSDYQRRVFVSVFRKRSAVMMLPAERLEDEDVRRLVESLRRDFDRRFVVVPLPQNFLYEKEGSKLLRRHAIKQAAAQGVELCFKKTTSER